MRMTLSVGLFGMVFSSNLPQQDECGEQGISTTCREMPLQFIAEQLLDVN